MGRSVFVTPLYKPGGREVLSYLLELEDLTILLDCGWNDAFDVADIQPLIEAVPKVDVVLLSHPDLEHLGALPYLVGKCGLEAPIYATLPVFKMGQMFMYDHWLSLRAVSDFEVFDLDDVDKAFTSINALKYQQELALEGAPRCCCMMRHQVSACSAPCAANHHVNSRAAAAIHSSQCLEGHRDIACLLAQHIRQRHAHVQQ
jgi:glyoxylase-like metal-dependent hydrolase (beta-lactamase superfamily II)